MAKTKKKSDSGFRFPRPWAVLQHLSDETRRSIVSILLVVTALVLLLAAAGAAGAAGGYLYSGLSYLLGIGYYLVPVLFILLAAALLRPIEHTFAYPKVVGGILFLVAGLGLVALATGENGGVLGSVIASPLVAFLDTAVTAIILSALGCISLLVMFDGALSGASLSRLFSLFRRKERDEEELGAYEYEDDGDLLDEDTPEDEEEYEEEPEEEYEETEEDETEEEESESRSGIGGLFGKKKSSSTAVPIATLSGEPYTPPPLSLLSKDKGKPGVGDIKANANLIKRTLSNFGIEVELDEISVGPTVTRYAIKPAEGVRLSRIVSLQNNLELALAAAPVRIEAPIPGRSLVGIEVPNSSKATVGLASLMADDGFQESDKPVLTALGKSITGAMHFANIAKMPHLLIAGATGSGKSVVIHTIITSLLYRNGPENLRFMLVDPKRVELTLYKNIPHLLTPVITDPKKAILALKWATKEMERRYDILEAETVRDIESYHTKVLAPAREKLAKKATSADSDAEAEEMPEAMPYIVVVIDELADLMQSYPRELESSVVRLAQMSRAVGIHLILSTQRPSVNVITGLIKANIPARIALQVSSQIDSRTILDAGGAERLLGAGDMLYLSGEMSKPQRLQSAYISEDEVKRVVQHLAKAYEDAVPNELSLTNGDGETGEENPIFAAAMEDEAAEDEDDLYEEARDTVIRAGKASTSFLQRKLRVGYSRAARLMDILEERGVVGPADGAKPREVLEQPGSDFDTASETGDPDDDRDR